MMAIRRARCDTPRGTRRSARVARGELIAVLTAALASTLALGAGCSGDSDNGAGAGGFGGADASASSSSATAASSSSASSSSSSATAGSSSSGFPPECEVSLDCGAPTACATPTCSDGLCDILYAPPDMLINTEPPGDCKKAVCDGAGEVVYVADDQDLPPDAPGDCRLPVCVSGEPTLTPDGQDLPSDGVDCTEDMCDGWNPAFPPKPINTACGPNDERFCHGDTKCKVCPDPGPACDDIGPGEPNGTQFSATNLGPISDNDGDAKDICGVIKDDDSDWYTLEGSDNFITVVDPYAQIIAGDSVRVCVYLQCSLGVSTVTCGVGSTPDSTFLGQDGCCSEQSFGLDIECALAPGDSASIWITAENLGAPGCVPYHINFHF